LTPSAISLQPSIWWQSDWFLTQMSKQADFEAAPSRGGETEKITINLSARSIWAPSIRLVEEGFDSNRTDLMRTAMRTPLRAFCEIDTTDAYAVEGHAMSRSGQVLAVASISVLSMLIAAANPASTAGSVSAGFLADESRP
jgi:ribbon-helix-helix protein